MEKVLLLSTQINVSVELKPSYLNKVQQNLKGTLSMYSDWDFIMICFRLSKFFCPAFIKTEIELVLLKISLSGSLLRLEKKIGLKILCVDRKLN